ncbi:uncharacterized protein LOC125035182 [Penaeus chinensis]|uniref:uncharacterized protein LOC125035182 n=1 Tax=Penaeus chinensis TaxID=139456 RepID=UPI001FB5AB25|nr:uncharacterized protein LOC125035182 [Penaeus chinensis]
MKERRLLLATSAGLLIIVFLRVALEKSFRRSPPPAVLKSAVENPTLKESCFDYVNFTAENVCCKMRKYTAGDVLRCVEGFSAEQRLQRKKAANIFRANSTTLPAVTHIALVGDSHMRNLFVSVVERIGIEKLQVRRKSVQNTWGDAKKVLKTMHLQTFIDTTEVRHMSAPFRVTWYRDWKLDGFPELIHRWETNQELRPSLVITGAAHHWMRKHPPRTGKPFRDFLTTLAPHLSRLASSVPIYFKLMDIVPTSYTEVKQYPDFNPQAIALYNSIAVQQLQETGTVFWDSTLRLSIAYTEECVRSNRITPATNEWNCGDPGHIGYIMLDQYADMIYNAFCNRFLNLTDDYCDTGR